ncbi:MAG: hypothetical protein GY831_23990, partial [Delftia sp.]|nr:hypothetical protein [Delftia sp.]
MKTKPASPAKNTRTTAWREIRALVRPRRAQITATAAAVLLTEAFAVIPSLL